MDKVQVEEIPKEEKQESPKESTGGEVSEHLSASRHFNIDTPSKEEDGKLAEVWEHAKSLSESKDITDIMWQIIHLEGVLGAPRLGETRLDKLYRYAKLKRQERLITEQLKNV